MESLWIALALAKEVLYNLYMFLSETSAKAQDHGADISKVKTRSLSSCLVTPCKS